MAALSAGKHVLVDKPMACTVADADEMIAAAERARRVLVPFQNTRFAAPFAAAAQQVREGAIGGVTGFRVAFGHAGPQAWAPQGDLVLRPRHCGRRVLDRPRRARRRSRAGRDG